MIKIPEAESSIGMDTLQYIRSFYEKLYKSEEVDHKVMEEIVGNPLEVTAEMNETLLREITKEEIEQVIKVLPDNKSLGTDGLTYKFYKGTANIVVTVLEKVFNRVLKEGKMP